MSAGRFRRQLEQEVTPHMHYDQKQGMQTGRTLHNPITRRAFLRATGIAIGGTAMAQQPAQPGRVKGPLVWLNLDQREGVQDQNGAAMSEFVICINNDSNPASLILGKVYRTLPDADAEARSMIRIIDEDTSEPDGYLYSASMLVPIQLPEAARKVLATPFR